MRERDGSAPSSQPETPRGEALSPAFRAAAGLHAELGARLLGVALFGSRARTLGESGRDWDLFVVAADLPPHPFDRAEIVRRATGPGFECLIATPEEFEGSRFPSIFLDIGIDGVVLCECGSYLSERLERIRRIVSDAGLVRGRDLAWRWKHPPRPGLWEIDWDGFRELG